MTRKEYRIQLLKRCGICAAKTPWCSVVQDEEPQERGPWGCRIEDDWRWFLKLGMPLEELLEKWGAGEETP